MHGPLNVKKGIVLVTSEALLYDISLSLSLSLK